MTSAADLSRVSSLQTLRLSLDRGMNLVVAGKHLLGTHSSCAQLVRRGQQRIAVVVGFDIPRLAVADLCVTTGMTSEPYGFQVHEGGLATGADEVHRLADHRARP